jgi:hypothetical protein
MSEATYGDLRLLPVDYHRQVARELCSFFHSFYRFGAASSRFDLHSESYMDFLHNVLLGSLAIGAVVFFVLAVIVVRRTILHIRSGTTSSSLEDLPNEPLAVDFGTVLGELERAQR